MCRINAFGRGCIRLEWFDSVLRTQLRGYRTHCRAAEDPVLRQKDVKAAEPCLPCMQRPLRPQAALHRPEPSGRWNNRDCFLFKGPSDNSPLFGKRVRRYLEMSRGGRG